MIDSVPPPSPTRSIAAVEHDTGLSKDTLRVWERRYGFPAPNRGALGERVYPIDQVDKLRVLRRLVDGGYRPGKIMHLPLDELRCLSESMSAQRARRAMAAPSRSDALEGVLSLVKTHNAEALRRELAQMQLRLGLEPFVRDVAAPMTVRVGDAWIHGELAIFEEHLFTEALNGVLRRAIGTIPLSAAAPKIILTTMPLERHSLGLLMAEALMALEGCACVPLGTEMPISEIAAAAYAHGADIVALSCTAALNPNHVVRSIAQLRALLGPEVELWAGGRCPVLQKRPPEGTQVLSALEDIKLQVQRWRSGSQASSAAIVGR